MYETPGDFFHFFFHLPIEKPSAFCYDGSACAPLIVMTKRHWEQMHFLCFLMDLCKNLRGFFLCCEGSQKI